jgi:hypothetical protein
MRIDMAKVVTEKPRRGHGNPSKKWGRRLGKNEHEAEDHGPTRAPIARRHQYGWNAKEFSDLLGPLRRYLRKQVGRPWNKVWSEIVRNLDSRSLSGQHIFDHIRWEVAQHVSLSPDGSLHHIRWSGLVPVSGLYVHPITGLLCYRRESWRGYRGGRFLKTQTALRAFGIDVSSAAEIRRFRVDTTRVWERRDSGWFIHSYRYVPEQLVRVITRSDGHDVPVYASPRYERVATKQASKKEIRDAQRLLDCDPLHGNKPQARERRRQESPGVAMRR